ncbi:MAG: glycoside hydrolase family 19 protein [Dongiaceae bacterium]
MDQHAQADEAFRRHRSAARQADLEAARDLFASQLPDPMKRRLVTELVETRGAELRRAYPALRAVAAGLRLRRQGPDATARIEDEPCVVLTVERKRPQAELPPGDRLPQELLCYVELGAVRRLCAVPTDVDEVAPPTGVRLDVASCAIEVVPEAGGNDVAAGVIACAIARPPAPGLAYLVSCRHILGHPNWDRKVADATTVRLRGGGGAVLARASDNFVGRIGNGIVSCDVQLAEISDPAAARAALRGPVFGGFARQASDIPKDLFVITPHGAVPVHFRQVVEAASGFELAYEGTGVDHIVHAALVDSIFAGAEQTVKGDSGSPVGTSPDGGVFVGMHIALKTSPDGVHEYAIPAWEVLAPENYDLAAAGETWQLVGAADIPVPAVPQPDMAAFVERFRQQFGQGLGASQQAGIKALMDCWTASWATEGWPGEPRREWLAYLLASCWHESAGRMQPVRETLESTDARVIAALDDLLRRGKISTRYYAPIDGRSYYGRGVIQVTLIDNYRRMGRRLGLGDQLVDNPDLALDPALSARIAVIGMVEGLFTTRKLADFDFTAPAGWIQARAIVNGGGDRASDIAGYGRKFLRCIA